jgi:hypothetical protein
MMHDKAMRRFGAVISSLVCGAAVACAGGDTPQVNDDLESAISETFGNGRTSVAGGTGGRAPTASAGAPAAGGGGAGGQAPAPGPPVAGAGAAGAPPTTGTPQPSTGGACDGFAVLAENCSGGSCHGAGGVGDFAESEEAAIAFVGVSGTATCGDEGPLLVPENPRQSVIVQKVNGTASCGTDMPIGAPPLSDDDISCLEEWIATL